MKTCDFDESKWHDLGQELGLQKSKLETISKSSYHDETCLFECLSQWVEEAEKDKELPGRGGATWDSLSDALRSINEITVADKLDQESEL